MQKIPATVVTGFLGAGKTTLIRNLLAQADGRRIALIINEFGDIGVDGEVLKGCGDAACKDEDVVELSNGCICCTVADDFIPTMKKLIERDNPPDHIVIETSGLALPQPLVRAFNWPDIRTKVTVDGVVTVVDGPAVAAGRFAHDEARVTEQRLADDSIDHDTPLADLFEDQLACADMIVVSKSDTMEEGAAPTISVLKERARQGVSFVPSGVKGLSPDVLLGMGKGAEDDMSVRHEIHHHNHDHHHDHDDAHVHDGEDDHHSHEHAHGHDEFESFALKTGEINDTDAFLNRISETIRKHDILRLKGFAAVAGKPMRLVIQAVGPRIETYFDRPFGEDPRETRLVVIGLHGMDEKAITTQLI